MAVKGKFLKITKANFKRAIGIQFIVSIILVVLFLFFDLWTDLTFIFINPDGMSVWYYYFFSVVFLGTYSSHMLPLLAALPFSASYCDEQQSGVTPLIIFRSSSRTYCISKMLVCAVIGGLTLSLGILLHTAVLSTQLPLLDADALRQMQAFPYCSAINNGTGIEYFLIGAYLAFLRGALASSAAMTVSVYFTNKYVTIASPFILDFIVVRFCYLMKIPNQARLDLLLRGRSGLGTDKSTLLVITATVILLIVILGFIFMRKVRRRIAYESFS